MGNKPNRSKIVAVVKKSSLFEKNNDAVYWRAQPAVERLAAIERIRQEYHGWKYGAEPRLQRVYKIVKRQ